MTWKEMMEFIKNRDCRVYDYDYEQSTEDELGISWKMRIQSGGRTFWIGLDYEDDDFIMTTTDPKSGGTDEVDSDDTIPRPMGVDR